MICLLASVTELVVPVQGLQVLEVVVSEPSLVVSEGVVLGEHLLHGLEHDASETHDDG